MSITHKDSYFSSSSYACELDTACNKATKNIPHDILSEFPDIAEKSLKIQTYLAEEFAKENITED